MEMRATGRYGLHLCMPPGWMIWEDRQQNGDLLSFPPIRASTPTGAIMAEKIACPRFATFQKILAPILVKPYI
jgi:hypothetical protein